LNIYCYAIIEIEKETGDQVMMNIERDNLEAYKAHLSQLRQDIEHHHHEINSSLQKPHHNLFHYTDSDGLLGIITCGTFWASHINRINGSKEIEYCWRMVQDSLLELFHSDQYAAETKNLFFSFTNPEKEPNSFAEHNEKEFNPFYSRQQEIFAISFHEENSLPNQWGHYTANATNGDPFCLTLHKQIFSEQILKRNLVFLDKVIYDPHLQQKILTQVVKETFRLLDDFIRNCQPNKYEKVLAGKECRNFVYQQLARYLPAFKPADREEEVEWRLLIIRNRSQLPEIWFRSLKGQITPYLEFNFGVEGKNGKIIPLNEIYCSPARHLNINQKIIELLLMKYAYKDVSIRTPNHIIKGANLEYEQPRQSGE
jgi:hypothetical protein